MTFTGTTAIVTGSAGGIGSAVVRALTASGAHVVDVDLDPGATVPVDLADPAAADEITAAALGAPGRLGVLVHCAFAEERADLLDGTDEGWARTFDISLHAAVRLSRAFVRALDGPGAIVLVGSVHGYASLRGFGAYAAAKAGLHAFTRSAAAEWGPRGVRVNAVAPGFVAVERNRALWQDPDRIGPIASAYPLRRVARPEEVASVVAFLAGGGASFVTGVTVPVDGGLLTRLPEVER